jgi:hypothetical protein
MFVEKELLAVVIVVTSVSQRHHEQLESERTKLCSSRNRKATHLAPTSRWSSLKSAKEGS